MRTRPPRTNIMDSSATAARLLPEQAGLPYQSVSVTKNREPKSRGGAQRALQPETGDTSKTVVGRC